MYTTDQSRRLLIKSLFSPTQPRRAETRLSPCGVLAALRGSTSRRSFSEVGNAGGAFPFAKIHSRGERPTRSAVCTSSPLRLLRPCWTAFLNNLLSSRRRMLVLFTPHTH